LKDLLDELAESAKLYELDDRMMAGAYRRRRVRQLAPFAAATVLVAIVAMFWLPLSPGMHQDEPVSTAITWLPSNITVPQNAPALPRTAVGPAVCYYLVGNADVGWPLDVATGAAQGRVVLVTAAGQQYESEYRYDPAGTVVDDLLSLSPNGRWLVLVRDGLPLLRDLDGGDERTLAVVPDRVAWSPDGRRLVLESGLTLGNPSGTIAITSIDLSTLRSSIRYISGAGALALGAVRDSGVLVFTNAIGSGSIAGTLYDPAAAQPRHDLRLPVAGGFEPNILVTPDGLRILLREVHSMAPGDIIELDLAAAAISKRYALPTPTFQQTLVPYGSGNRFAADLGDWRDIVAVLPQGLLLAHHWYASHQFRASLELLDSTTGRLSIVTRFVGVVAKIDVAASPTR
jgi:hypothetical protein